MTTGAPSKFNFTPEQRQHLADAYRLILSWRRKRNTPKPDQLKSSGPETRNRAIPGSQICAREREA